MVLRRKGNEKWVSVARSGYKILLSRNFVVLLSQIANLYKFTR